MTHSHHHTATRTARTARRLLAVVQASVVSTDYFGYWFSH